MKRFIIILLLLITALSLLAGCSKSVEASIKEVDISSEKNEALRRMIQTWESKNGAYLVELKDKNECYLFLNAANIKQGDKASYFESLTINMKDNTLVISYIESSTDKLDGIRNKVLYKIPQTGTYDTVRIFRNREEAHFESVTVLENK